MNGQLLLVLGLLNIATMMINSEQDLVQLTSHLVMHTHVYFLRLIPWIAAEQCLIKHEKDKLLSVCIHMLEL